MLLAAALLLAAEPAAAAPERQMLDSLKAACDRAGDLDAMKADAKGAGWEPIADDADPRVAKLNRTGREMVGSEGQLAGASYRRTLGGRELFLILSRYEAPGGTWGAGCRLYDFTATAPLDAAALQAWMGKPPTGSETPAPGVSRRLWEPGWRDGITLEASHVPQGHALGEALGLSGNVLVAQAIGGF